VTAFGKIRVALVGIPSEKAVFSRPGFSKEAWIRFEPIAHALVVGYHASLEDSRSEALAPRLDAFEPKLRGFAYEGAGMGIAALDILSLRKNRLKEFVDGPGAPHIYPIYVGVGLALARLRRQPEKYLHRLDPLLSRVVIDGYGFHEGFFSWKRFVLGREAPAKLSGYACHLFDQGLGRSIWFSSGATPSHIIPLVTAFASDRQADLWSGIAMACTFAGGASRAEVEELRAAAKDYPLQLAQGAAIAAKGQQQANLQTAHTELACEIFCNMSSEQAAHITDIAREDLPTSGPESAYEVWLQRTQAQFTYERTRP
jgi:hypothetical protein